MYPTKEEFDATKPHVWNVDDCEWWIGAGSRDEIKKAVMDEYNYTEEDMGDHPILLSDADLERLTFWYGEEGRTPDSTNTRTFREQMEIDIAAGIDKPRMFACEEC